jgi:TRAP-type C4-dicarboxylate transport system permease small subunit
MKTFLKRLDIFIYQLEKVLIVCALIVMALVVFLQVVLRAFNMGFPWAEELARYLMIWAGFMGASIATKQRRHLKIDVLPRLLSSNGRAKAIVIRLASLISAVFCFFLVKVGYEFVVHSVNTGRTSTSMGLPIWVVQLAIPITTVVIACRFLGQTFGEIQQESDVERLLEKENE